MAVLVACAVGVEIGLMLVWANARSAITIAVVEIVDGRATVTRGGLSSRVLDDLRDVASRPTVKRATVRILRAKDRGRVEVEGEVSEQQMQRLRNIVGNVPAVQLARAKRP
jgi:hypothetical protein